MKKLIICISAFALVFISCEKDEQKNETTNLKLLTKSIEDIGGFKTTRLYEYNGAKIKTITETSDEGTTIYTYKYDGDNIIKITETNEDKIVTKTMSFVYVGDKLATWAENYETDSEVNFFAENVVSIKDTTISSNYPNAQVLKYYNAGVLEKEVLHSSVSNEHSFLTNFINTNKLYYNNVRLFSVAANGTTFNIFGFLGENPHKNITGWAKLERLDPALYNSFNLVHDQYTENIVGGGDRSYLNFLYTPENFPTNMSRGSGLNNFTGAGSTQYFYNK